MYFKQLIIVVFGLSFIYTTYSLPNNGFRKSRQKSVDTFQQRQYYHPYPKASSNIFYWTKSKLKQGQKNLKTIWNNFKTRITPVNRRRGQLKATERNPASDSVPLWRSFVSKAWSYLSGFFQRSERYIAKRRMDTGRQGAIAALLPAVSVWAMPIAMVGVTALLRGPLDMIANEIARKFQL